MANKKRPYHDGLIVTDFLDVKFEKDLREAALTDFPAQSNLESPMDEVLWILWVLRDYFEHRVPAYAEEIAHLLEVRGIASGSVNIERALARADSRVIKKKFEKGATKSAYAISEKGVLYLKKKFAASGIKTVVIDGNSPWSDRHLTLPEIAKELKGKICVVDKFYGIGSLNILRYLKHGTPLQFLTGKTNESQAAFQRELRDFKKEVASIEVRAFPTHHDLHDRYILSKDALVIIGHGIKDIGSKESFLILLKGPITADLRQTLQEKFDDRWKASTPIT